MRKIFLTLAVVTLSAIAGRGEVTIEQCLDAARDNYPLIRQYDLLSVTEAIDLSDINKGWLPRLGLYAQGTVQNVVPSFPAALSSVMQQLGSSNRGIGKVQYKVGLDVNQTIWDGGASTASRELTRRQTAVNRARLDVEMYAIRQRVESIYFGILLLELQIKQAEMSQNVYSVNLERMRAMLANGTAMRSDVDMLEAQWLTIGQQIASARSTVKGYREVLSIFTGLDITSETLTTPSVELPLNDTNSRPELALFDAQQALNASRVKSIDVTLRPKVGFFAQTYYGYPGIDYFKAMQSRDLTLNILAGVKVSWSIDAFYTRHNALNKVDVAKREIESQRATFLFNSSMQTQSQTEAIRGIEAVMADDARIVELRRNVRLAAESQLRNGIIDATALTTKINDETQAMYTAVYHTIQRLQAIYALKNTLNQ